MKRSLAGTLLCLFLTCFHCSLAPSHSRSHAVSIYHALWDKLSCTLSHSHMQYLSLSHLPFCSFACLHILNQILLCTCQTFDLIPHDSLCVAGSKTQSNRADTGLWCLSGQGPRWAHGWGHHCLPEVRLFVCIKFGMWRVKPAHLCIVEWKAPCGVSDHTVWATLLVSYPLIDSW